MLDLILFNANVLTMNPAFPRARLVAIKDGRVFSINKNDPINKLIGPRTKIIDCNGKTVIPGLIDPHLHFLAFSESQVTVDLSPRNGIRSISHIKSKIAKQSKGLPPGIWIRGGGYDDFHLEEKRHPNRWDLDSVVSSHPVKLTHRSGHAHVLNSLALRLAGITRETPDPPYGIIERDIETGEPTGLLYGMGDWLQKVVPPIDSIQLREGIKRANEILLSSGITSFHDTSHRNDMERFKRFEEWKEEGLIKPTIIMAFGKDYLEDTKLFCQKGNKTLIRGVKIIVEETTGAMRPSQKELNEFVLDVHRRGFQAIIHAIEEGPIEAACNAVEYALKKFPRKDHRHRIEHCSLCPPSLADRISSLGIVVVTHPSFIYYNGERYLKTVPELKMEALYPLRRLMKRGVVVAGASDCPVVPPDPMMGIFSAVTRICKTGERIAPKEGIDNISALRLYTSNAAMAIFEEGVRGMIYPGKRADLVVLSGDPVAVSDQELLKIRVNMTIISGEVVWEMG